MTEDQRSEGGGPTPGRRAPSGPSVSDVEEAPLPARDVPGTTQPSGATRGSRSTASEPPRREARGRIAGAWAAAGPGGKVLLSGAGVVAVGLLGACGFGIWHVVIGGFLKGNWNAAGFGIALAGVAGAFLWIEAALARRILPPSPEARVKRSR